VYEERPMPQAKSLISCIDCRLDLGSPYFQAMSAAQKAIDGLFQSLAVRAAGFAIVPISETAPAVQVAFVGMMVRSY
jgi:Trk-type K+ transport system membrane component